MDVWINATVENALKMVRVLDDFGFSSFGLTEGDFTEPGNVIQMGYPPFRIDVLTTIDGVDFEGCYQNRMIVQHDEIALNVIGMSDLKVNKQASGRSKDIEDLENLKNSDQ